MPEIQFLIKAESEVKARYNRLLDYFDHPTSLQQIREDLYNAITDNDMLTHGLCWLLLNLEFISGRETDYSIFEDLANFELDLARVGSFNEGMIIALGLIGVYKEDTSDLLFNQLQRMTYKYIQRTKGFYFSKDGTRHPNLALTPYLTICRLRQNPEDRDLAADFITKAIEEKDWTFFRMLVKALTEQVSYSGNQINTHLVLRALRIIFPIPKGTEIEVEPVIIDALSRIRIYDQNAVDNFLLEIDPGNNLLPRVLRTEPDEEVWGELFHDAFAKVLVRLLAIPEIKNLLVKILRQAPNLKNLDKYLELSVKILINELVGEEIFGKSQ